MVTYLQSLWGTILSTADEIWQYLSTTIVVNGNSVTVLSILVGSGLVVALIWNVLRWVIGFS